MLDKISKPIANPNLILREEFDSCAILFDPDTGKGFGVNPVGILVWRLLDGEHTVEDIQHSLRERCENVPESAQSDVECFIEELLENGLAGLQARN